jgi:hypothetical protein
MIHENAYNTEYRHMELCLRHGGVQPGVTGMGCGDGSLPCALQRSILKNAE